MTIMLQESWTFELKYDPSKNIEYQSFDVSSDFNTPSVSTTTSGIWSVVTFMTAAPTAAGSANPGRRTGTYYAMSIKFKFTGGTQNGIHDDLFSLELVTLINSGNNAFVTAEPSQIADRRDTTDAGVTTAQMEVYSNDEVGILPYHNALGGALFDTSKIDGTALTYDIGATVIKRYHVAAHHSSRAYKSASITTCNKITSTSAFETSIISGSCRITYDTQSTQTIGFTVSDGSFTSGTIISRIVVPQSVSIVVQDATLNQIDSLDCSSTADKYSFQSTRIKVLADGLDVTSMAKNMISSNTNIANFRTSSGTEKDAILQGKSVGTTTIQLFSGSDVTSSTITVSSTPVTVVEMFNRIITDVSFQTTPPSAYTYPGNFDSKILVQQTMSQPPLGDIRAHYGYLFTTVIFSDNSEEFIYGDEIATSQTSTNIVWTEPGGTDTTVSSLSIQNDYSDRWMVSEAPNAYQECILETEQASVKATWQRCSSDIIPRGVPMLINPPAPTGITFQILKSTLAPTNNPASFAPFNVPTTSGFSVSVSYEDGTTITSYASESNVIYYVDETSCATVTNAATDSLLIDSGATCTSVTVHVNVTFGDVVFHASDSSIVATLSTVVTTLRAYPSGSSNINSLHTLPCVSNYEKGSLQTIGTLSTGTTKTVTSYMTYTVEDTGIASVSSSVITPQSAGSTQAGSQSNVNLQGDMTNVVVTPCSFQVHDQARSVQSYGGSWSLGDESTISKTKGSTVTTTFTFSYTDTNGVYFSYSNFFKSYTYFQSTDILEFSSQAPDYLSIDSVVQLLKRKLSSED